MSENHENEGVCPIIEEHRRKETASVLFWPAVVELFPSFEERGRLFDALGDEINSIPSDVIPYGTLTYRQLLFVYQSRWDADEEMYFMNIDLAAGCVEVGHVLDNFDDTSIDAQLFSNETVH